MRHDHAVGTGGSRRRVQAARRDRTTRRAPGDWRQGRRTGAPVGRGAELLGGTRVQAHGLGAHGDLGELGRHFYGHESRIQRATEAVGNDHEAAGHATRRKQTAAADAASRGRVGHAKIPGLAVRPELLRRKLPRLPRSKGRARGGRHGKAGQRVRRGHAHQVGLAHGKATGGHVGRAYSLAGHVALVVDRGRGRVGALPGNGTPAAAGGAHAELGARTHPEAHFTGQGN